MALLSCKRGNSFIKECWIDSVLVGKMSVLVRAKNAKMLGWAGRCGNEEKEGFVSGGGYETGPSSSFFQSGESIEFDEMSHPLG